jgi:putative hydrolase of the HAD superfamily
VDSAIEDLKDALEIDVFQSEFPMIQAVIFDFGRVISAQKPESLFRGYEQELGLPSGTINTIMFESAAWREALLGRKTTAEFWTTIGPQLGLNSPRQIEDFRRRYHADERINPHVLDLMGRLFGVYKLAVCSNSPPGLAQWLADWEIDHLFDVVFCSGDEGIVKPDPAAYLATVTRLGVKPFETVFVDDAWENVAAASAQGLRAIHFTDGPALVKELRASLTLPEGGSAVPKRPTTP